MVKHTVSVDDIIDGLAKGIVPPRELVAETLPAEGPSGWFRRGTRSEETVLIFRRARGESLEPRLAAPRAEEESPRTMSAASGTAATASAASGQRDRAA